MSLKFILPLLALFLAQSLTHAQTKKKDEPIVFKVCFGDEKNGYPLDSATKAGKDSVYMVVPQKDYNMPDTTEITLINNTDSTLYGGRSYKIERKENGRWVDFPKDCNLVEAIGVSIKPV